MSTFVNGQQVLDLGQEIAAAEDALDGHMTRLLARVAEDDRAGIHIGEDPELGDMLREAQASLAWLQQLEARAGEDAGTAETASWSDPAEPTDREWQLLTDGLRGIATCFGEMRAMLRRALRHD